MSVHIVSYNVLVPIYAKQSEYIKSEAKYLQTDYRWKLIEKQLEQEIVNNENTIICLQELSLKLLPKFELFFRRLNYSLYNNLYGYRRNDYMGVGIAIPLSMELDSISFIKVGDYIRSLCKNIENDSNILTWGWNICQSFISKFIKSSSDPWNTAMIKNNTLIHLKVRIEGKSLCIGTYHMPCAYKEPDVMSIHSAIVKDLMFQLSSGENFILAGDFNIKPLDMFYHILTEKNDTDFKLPQSNKYTISYKSNNKQKLKSAYQVKNGKEPNYTNFSDTTFSSCFCETLDYIFFSGKLTVEKVLDLPDNPTSESYPDETHPSDHLMIAATFRI